MAFMATFLVYISVLRKMFNTLYTKIHTVVNSRFDIIFTWVLNWILILPSVSPCPSPQPPLSLPLPPLKPLSPTPPFLLLHHCTLPKYPGRVQKIGNWLSSITGRSTILVSVLFFVNLPSIFGILDSGR